MATDVFVLLVLFQFKHLIADYYLQFPYMYENKGKESGWVRPLFDHAFVHTLMTFVIVAFFVPITLLYLAPLAAIFDFTTHFVTDRWKATRGVGPDTSKFWTNLGIDQMVHHLVGIIIVWSIT